MKRLTHTHTPIHTHTSTPSSFLPSPPPPQPPLQRLSFQSIQVNCTAIDCQPRADGTIFVFVIGQIQVSFAFVLCLNSTTFPLYFLVCFQTALSSRNADSLIHAFLHCTARSSCSFLLFPANGAQTDDDPLKGFSQGFVLAPTPDGSFYIQNDCFRLAIYNY